MKFIGLDCYTKGHKEIMRRLLRLKATITVAFGGEYNEDRHYCQVHIATEWTETELDDWLYRQKGIDYVGTFASSAEHCGLGV